MANFPGPIDFQFSSPQSEPGRDEKDELQHPMHIPRSFAIGTKEVTMEQFLRFRPDFKFVKNQAAPEMSCPVNSVTWIEAAEYCRWLSEQEGIPEAEWVYPRNLKIEYGMTLPNDFIRRQGYRLPTEAEWEYACRSGAVTRFCFGNDIELLKEYGWYFNSSPGHSQPVGLLRPNLAGLFDVHGNVKEWCHDLYRDETELVDTGEGQPLRNNPDQFENVTRGGAYISSARDLRSANRRGDSPTGPNLSTGFRIARTVLMPSGK